MVEEQPEYAIDPNNNEGQALQPVPSSSWNPFSWIRRYQEVVEEKELQESFAAVKLLTLPMEIREMICDFLSPGDLKSVRLVCHRLKRDVDIVLGVRLRIDRDIAKPGKWDALRNRVWFLGKRLTFRDWVSTVNVRSLNVTRLLPDFEIKGLVTKPSWVRSLTINLDDSTQSEPIQKVGLDPFRGNLTELLTGFNNVTLLRLYYRKCDFETVEEVGEFFDVFCRAISSKRNLKTLDLALWADARVPEPELPNTFPTYSFPTQLRHLQLIFWPTRPYEISAWKALLGAQEQLRSLDLFCCDENAFRIFSPEIKRLAPILSHLKVSAWAYRVETHFDLSILSEAKELKCLAFRRPPYEDPGQPASFRLFPTNFNLLPAEALQEVQLDNVHLLPEHLVQVLLDPINLKHVCITFWTLGEDSTDPVFRILGNMHLAAVVGILLPKKTIQTLFLQDLSFAPCPFPFEGTMSHLAAKSGYNFAFSLAEHGKTLRLDQ